MRDFSSFKEVEKYLISEINDQTIIIDGDAGKEYTAGDFFKIVNAIRATLAKKKIKSFSKIGLVTNNMFEYVCFLFAIISYGCVCVVLSPPMLLGHTINDLINIIKPDFVIASSFFDKTLKFSTNSQIKYVDIDDFDFFNNEYLPAKDIDPEQIAYITTSSGSTGDLKCFSIKIKQFFKGVNIDDSNFVRRRIFVGIGIFRSPFIGIYRAMAHGKSVVVCNKHKTDFFKCMRTYKPDCISTTSNEFDMIINTIKQDIDHYRFIKSFVFGGAKIVNEKNVEFAIQHKIEINFMYGLIEGVAYISNNPMHKTHNYQSVGNVNDIKLFEYRIVNGYLEIKGDCVFEKYLNVDNNLYFDKNGWFKTKDPAWIDEKGYLYIGERELKNITWKTYK